MTQDEVRLMFEYEADTGMLRRIGGRKPYPFRPFGNGGRYLGFSHKDGRTYSLHQLVWIYHHGALPEMIDHRDNDPRNNRIENLRACTNAQNQYNSSRKVNNRSGFKGVVFHPKCKSRPWQAKIAEGGKVRSLGYYPTPEQAGAAYAAGAPLVAGQFARS